MADFENLGAKRYHCRANVLRHFIHDLWVDCRATDKAATVAGTATPDTDYAALAGTVIIPAGLSSVTVQLDPIDDLASEAAERVQRQGFNL